MTSTVTADDKCRLKIDGARPHRKYVVTEAEGGWWIMPSLPVELPKRPRQWAGSKQSLASHLRSLAEHGLTLVPSAQSRSPVPPCRF